LSNVWWRSARSPSVCALQRIGVTKNHGRSAAASTCSTSRKTTLRQAATSASPATWAAKRSASGIASHTVERASATKISERRIRITAITANVTACVATIENATSCRGNLTFLTRSAASTSERAADCIDVAKKIQHARPASRYSA